MIDWSLFDKEYPVKDGIVVALPEELSYDVDPQKNTPSFFDVQSGMMGKYVDVLHDKGEMAQMQKEFYDRVALGFQRMDDVDLSSGGIFWWKIRRCAFYDEAHFKGKKLLFIGAGNCRLARIYAQMGYDVVATDISFNMLKVGRSINEKQGIPMTYVCHNAEIPFPFRSAGFDTVYSLCVINHIVDWDNYVTEKLRCIRNGGVMLERMPNAGNWRFWKTQGILNDGVEIKAKYCNPMTVRITLCNLGLDGRIWTHDRQEKLDFFHVRTLKLLHPFSKMLYDLRAWFEDSVLLPLGADNGLGIYTLFKIIKDEQK